MIFTKFLDFKNRKIPMKNHIYFSIFCDIMQTNYNFWHFMKLPECHECKSIHRLKKHVMLKHIWYFMSNIYKYWSFLLKKKLVHIFLSFIGVFLHFLGFAITNTKYFSLSSSKNMRKCIRITVKIASSVFFCISP